MEEAQRLLFQSVEQLIVEARRDGAVLVGPNTLTSLLWYARIGVAYLEADADKKEPSGG